MIIRKYTDRDMDFILSLAPRFTEIEYLRFREPSRMITKQEEMAMDAVNKNSSNIYIAERNGQCIGYIELKNWVDYFTGERQGYVSALAVTKEFEGTGVSTSLMKKAEDWAKQRGYNELVLQVFTANEKAITLYEKLGYKPDITVMVKQI